jgi:hypothetical protein
MVARSRRRPTRDDFEIAVFCALTLEADAVEALFDHCWDDDDLPCGKALGDPNTYSTGTATTSCSPLTGHGQGQRRGGRCPLSIQLP